MIVAVRASSPTSDFLRHYWGTSAVTGIRLSGLVGVATKRGGRRTNQDRYKYSLLNTSAPKESVTDPNQIVPVNPLSYLYAGVFDGHNGANVAEFVSQNLDKHLDGVRFETVNDKIYEAFGKVSADLKQQNEREEIKSGTTAIMALLGFSSDSLVIANLGDCQGVICRNGRSRPLSNVHSTANIYERERVARDGGVISEDSYGSLRVNASTETTRSIGASEWLNPGVSGTPEIMHFPLHPSDEDSFFVLGSDGIFNHLTRQAVVDIVKICRTPQEAANMLAVSATVEGYDDDLIDNATALVVKLKGWGKHVHTVNYTQELKKRNLDTIFGMLLEPDDHMMDLIDAKARTEDILKYIFYEKFEPVDGLLKFEDIQKGMSKMGKYMARVNAMISVTARDANFDQSISFSEFCSYAMKE